MEKEIQINLFRKSSFSQEEALFLKKFRLFSVAFLFCMLLLGILSGIVYTLGKVQYDRLEQRRFSLSKMIGLQSKKQDILELVQERIAVIEKIIDSRYSFDKVLQIIAETISPEIIKTVLVGSGIDFIVITVQSDSLEEIQSIVARIVKQTEDKKIYYPIINSLNMNQDGKIEAVFSFKQFL